MVKGPYVIVRFIRELKYPMSMLHPSLYIQDAIMKGKEDIVTEMQEITENEFRPIDNGFFTVEAHEECGFALRTPRPVSKEVSSKLKKINNKLDFHDAIKSLTMAYMKDKYGGPLDAEKSPHLFDHEEAKISPKTGAVISPEQWYLKPEVEKEYHNKYDYYFSILKNIIP